MGREDADHGHSGAPEPPARNGQLQRHHTRSGDDRRPVEHTMEAIRRQQTREALGVLGGRLPAEVVADHGNGLPILVEIAGGANAERHQAILCVVASSTHRE